jgi:ABC-type multidrug transport system ATPase subunit
MPIALEVRALTKRYVAGLGSCSIRADVLRGIDLSVYAGEAVAVVGGASAGKSTLLLCAAGLLRPDAGAVRWFDESSTAAAALRSTFYFAGVRGGRGVRRLAYVRPHVHLVDAIERLDAGQVTRFAAWVSRRRAAGDAVMISSRDGPRAAAIADRVLVMRGGRIELESRVPARVAENRG